MFLVIFQEILLIESKINIIVNLKKYNHHTCINSYMTFFFLWKRRIDQFDGKQQKMCMVYRQHSILRRFLMGPVRSFLYA